ncbi:lipopolysaccharide biosynthesis protein [Kaistella sp.]|uniref:lipopolysaccharide biosynthesis protein n=1 Tax=Kaistella sp. TaxID=2782235 RepID=UPI003C3E8ECF
MSLRKQAISGMVWTYSQQFGTQILAFGVSVILARLLTPSEFGLIGMLAIFMGIGNALFEGGLASSLIRSKEVTTKDYSTVFIFNLVASFFIYAIIYLIAPLISDFYRQPELTKITRVYALTFILSAFGTVQNTILTRELKFKKQALITLPGLLLGSGVGVILAYMGFGVWALVYYSVLNSLFTTLFLWINSDWKPQLVFDKNLFHTHFHYGYKLTLSSVLDIIFTNAYQIIIGRFYSAAQVGYYTRANSLMMLPVGNVSTALNKVIFPVFSQMQDDLPRFRNVYKQVMQIILFIIMPIIVIMAIEADPIVVFLFTDKWLPVVPIFQIICFTGVLYPIHLYNLLVLQVRGRSDLFLKLEIVKKVILTIIIVTTLFFGFYELLWGQLIFSVIALLINTHYAGRMLGYNVIQQMKDILPIFAFAAIMGVSIYFLDGLFVKYGDFIRILMTTTIGFAIYILTSLLFKSQIINHIKSIKF